MNISDYLVFFLRVPFVLALAALLLPLVLSCLLFLLVHNCTSLYDESSKSGLFRQTLPTMSILHQRKEPHLRLEHLLVQGGNSRIGNS